MIYTISLTTLLVILAVAWMMHYDWFKIPLIGIVGLGFFLVVAEMFKLMHVNGWLVLLAAVRVWWVGKTVRKRHRLPETAGG